MRHVDLTDLLTQILADADGMKAKAALKRAHKKMAKKRSPNTRKKYVKANGGTKWRPVKDLFTNVLGKKCWYTEVELIGAPLVVDHFRPVCHYWWLAFDVENYRVSCPWANSPEHNALHGCAGGKGDNFPLLPPAVRATERSALPNERPVIMDPCNAQDCDLLAFQADGRPIVHPNVQGNADATYRVQQSMTLLNLDHPDFNSQREQLYHQTAEDVLIYQALPDGSPLRRAIQIRMEARIVPKAQFSTAARFYLQMHRHLDWVEAMLNSV